MKDERKPLLSDEHRDSQTPYKRNIACGDAWKWGFDHCRREYEDLITNGKLRVVEDVAPSFIHGEIKCSKCEGRLGNTYADALPNYCHRCGNKINRA
jgi:hypothetical protein